MKRIGWFVLLGVVAGMIVWTAGCSANHWGGDASGKSPGLNAKAGLFGNELSITGNGETVIGSAEYHTDKDSRTLIIKDAKLNQEVTTVTAAQVEKIAAIAKLQETQVAYVAKIMDGLVGIVKAVAPALEMLAAGTFAFSPDTGCTTCTLPASAGTPGDVQAQIQQALAFVQSLRAAMPSATQPAAGQ